MIFIIFAMFLFNIFLFGDISHGILEQYKNSTFISTNFNNGLHIVKAINANFPEVICLEPDKVFFDHSKFVISAYFRTGLPSSLTNYNIVYGESSKVLSNVMQSVNKPVTFLLCSHLPDTDHPEKINPVLNELEIIKNHAIKQHTILIDYINWAGTVWFGSITLQSIMDKILSINENYKFKFVKGGQLEKQENAVLVAYP